MSKKERLRIAYQKELKRIKNYIRRNEKKGYVFDFETPKTPKRITEQSINRLKKITSTKLVENGKYLDYATGELIPMKRKQYLNRREAAITANRYKKIELSGADFWSKVIINNFITTVKQYNVKAQKIVLGWFDKQLKDNDIGTIARMLEEASGRGVVFVYKVAYDEKLMMEFISEMGDCLNFIKNETEDLLNSFEELKQYDKE